MNDFVHFRIILGKPLHGKSDVLEVELTPPGEKFIRKINGFSNKELKDYLSEIETLSYSSKLTTSVKREQLKTLGARLFELIFQGAASQKYEEVIHSGKPILIEIYGQDPRLQILPWEFMYDTKYRQFLSPLDTIPIVRLIELPRLVIPQPVERLSVLVVISSPRDLPPLNVLQEKRNIRIAFQESKDKIDVDFLENADFTKLSNQLLSNKYNILHFIGHGGVNTDINAGYICLENEAGQSELISGESLGLLLRNTRSIHLVVLNACESARTIWPLPFTSMANSLISMDVPAVVAMQFPISDQAALAFSRAFYSAVAQGYDLSRAMAQARRRIHHDTIDMGSSLIHEWGIPVLFLGNSAINQFVLTTSNNLPVPTSISETALRENAYLNSLVNLNDFRNVRETYIPLKTIPNWLWENDSRESAFQAMRGGLPDQDEISDAQQQMGLQLLDEIAKHDRVVVIGKPGSGKTTTLRYLTQHYASLALQDNLRAKLPLLTNLNEYKSGQNIIDFLKEQLAGIGGSSSESTQHLSNNIESYLEDGRLVLLFDGLNELLDYRSSIKSIGTFMRIYPNNKYIFTGRDSDYRGELNIDAQLHIDQLNDKQIVDFVERQRIDGVDGTAFLQYLKDNSLIELARSPFMLSLIVKNNKSRSDHIQSRAELITWAVSEMWTREHNRLGQDGWIEDHIETEVLRNLAWHMNNDHLTAIERLDAESITHDSLQKIGNATASELVLKQALNAGILRVSPSQYLRFQHQLLQDYFAALKLRRQFEINESLNSIISDATWNDAIVLLAGLLGENAYNLIQTILDQPDDLFLNNFWLAAKCFADIRNSRLRNRLNRIGLVDRLVEIFSKNAYTILRKKAETALVEIGDSLIINRLENIINEINTPDANSKYSFPTPPSGGLKYVLSEWESDAHLPVRSIRAIEKIGTTRAVSFLIQVLENQSYSNFVQARAAEALGNLGGVDAENALIHVLNDPNQQRQIRLRTVSAFGRLHTEIAYQQLLNIIKSPTEMSLIRERAVAALASYIDSEEVRTILINLLKDTSQSHALRSRASDILVRINDNQVREIFLGLLSNPNESIHLRAKAALCLGALGNSAEITVLSDITQDHRYELRLRWCAAYAIGYILRKIEDKPSIVLLSKILEDENENHFVRWTAAYALGFSQDEKALQSLTRTAASKSIAPDVKRRIIESISKFKIDDAVDILVRLYNLPEQDADTKDAILLGLCSIGGEQARDILVEAVKNKQANQNIQRRIIIALGVLGDEVEISLLQNIINDETISIELRDAAFTALEQISRSLRKHIYALKKEPTMTIEMLSIPILTKAIDFLFDETQKILEERREVRKNKGSDAASLPNIPLLNQNKDDVLKEIVSEKDFKSLSSKIEASIREVETYQRNLQNIRNTIASQGGIVNADIRWRNLLKENEDGLLEASQRLAQLINDITKK